MSANQLRGRKIVYYYTYTAQHPAPSIWGNDACI